MRLSLKRIGDSIRDLVDANTADDQKRRMAAGQPQYYAQQQQQLQSQGKVRPINTIRQNFGGATRETFTQPKSWQRGPRLNVGSWKGSGLVEDLFNSPFKVGMGGVQVGQGQIKQGVGNIASGLIEGPLGLMPLGKTAQAARGVRGVMPAITAGAKQGAKEGAIYGGAYGASVPMRENQDWGKVAQGAAFGTAAGGLGGALLGGGIPAAGAGARATMRAYQANPYHTQAGFAKIPGAKDPLESLKVEKYGWKTEATPEGIKLFNRNDKHVATIRQEKNGRFTALHNDGTKIGSDGDATRLADDVASKYFYATELPKAPAKPTTQSQPPKSPPKSAPKPVKAVTKPIVTKKVDVAQSPPTPVKAETPKLNDIEANLRQLIHGDTPTTLKERPLGKLAEKLSVGRQIRKATRPVEETINKGVGKGLRSGTAVLRTPARTTQLVNRQAGRSPEEITKMVQVKSGARMGEIHGKAIARRGDEAVKQGVRKEAVFSALDPELHKAKGGKPYKLTPAEQEEVKYLRGVMDQVHEGNYAVGHLSDEAYQANKGKYFPRNFDAFFEDDVGKQIARQYGIDTTIFKKRSILDEIPKEVRAKAETDPYFMAALRTQQFEKNKSYQQHAQWLVDSGRTLDAPKKGYIQVPESSAYGPLKGKYVLKEELEDLQGFIYETETAQHAMALINSYDRFLPRQIRKKLLTVFNPGVRVGNQTFNYLISSLNGVNPITFGKNYNRARSMIRKNDPTYLEAVDDGIFGSTWADKELYRGKDALTAKKKNVLEKTTGKVQDTYSAVDDKARLAIYLSFRERGVPRAEAANRTRRYTQNYDMVGQAFDQGAKTPILGNAFIRFSAELMRIAHNSAVDNPQRLVGAVMAVAALTSYMSAKSGETPEDRKTREDRLGAPKIPFTDQSLEVQTPWGAVNVGRLLGVTTYNDLNGGFAQETKRLLPFQSPINIKDGKVSVNKLAFTTDPLIGPAIGQLLDTDFRGKPISDPDKAKYPNQPLPAAEQRKNRLNSAIMSYTPLANEADSLGAAMRGEKNYYGKERTPVQAALRIAGIKVEKFGPKQAKEQRGKDEYFSGEFKEVENWKRENSNLADDYDMFKGREKDRATGKKYFDLVTPERWNIVKTDTSGKLFDRLKTEAMQNNKKDGQPIDPIYLLPTKEQINQVLELRSRPSGEDIETEEILRATKPWYAKLEKAERAYFKDNTEYFKKLGLPDTQGERSKAYFDVPYAGDTKSELIKQYEKIKFGDEEKGIAGDPDGAKAFYKSNADQLSADYDKYTTARLAEINAKRKIEGYPPIDANTFANVTFGYEDDERKVFNELKYGKGYGGYGGGRGRKGVGSLYDAAVSLNAGGAIAKPKVSVKGGSKAVAKAKIGKPKVTIKKSKV